MMSSSSAMEGATTIENDVEKESLPVQQEIQVDLESEMKNGGQEGEIPIGEVDNLASTTTSENPNNSSNPSYRLRGNSNQGEMERRAEERLLDERIREKYRREIGDIFLKK